MSCDTSSKSRRHLFDSVLVPLAALCWWFCSEMESNRSSRVPKRVPRICSIFEASKDENEASVAQIKSENTAFLLLECSKNCLFCLPKLNLLNSYRECCKNLNICVLRNKFWIKSASEDSHNLSVSLVHVKTFTNVALRGYPPTPIRKRMQVLELGLQDWCLVWFVIGFLIRSLTMYN